MRGAGKKQKCIVPPPVSCSLNPILRVAKNRFGNETGNLYSNAMIQTRVNTTPQQNKIQQVETALTKLLADSSQRGFYGEAAITLSVQDGVIQHIRVAMERMIK